VMEPTPEKFGNKIAEAVQVMKDWPEEDRILFINAWNEWTEGSYLEPDVKHGYGFLEALKKALYS
ncbi:MAG: glycoside hydrolase family 99-like domain-containing protein, partial [Lentisphaeria bacterium]|nr:glycoside hydrolase family 99-like domain-containing protein [Lentisphaeria bacterium]